MEAGPGYGDRERGDAGLRQGRGEGCAGGTGSTNEGVRVGATCAWGTKRSFGPAPKGCWRPGGV